MPVNPRKVKHADEQLTWERCRRDAHVFIFEYVRTKDEHDTANPIKPFPDTAYLRGLLDALLVSGHLLKPSDGLRAHECGHSGLWLQALASSGILLVEKSRQVMATWLCCAYLLWRAKFREHQLILVQSKREDDAANLVFNREPFVARISFMELMLPPYLKSLSFPRNGAFAQLTFPNGSRIWGIPEGSDIIRSNTASVIFSDEAAFQPEFGGAFTAALPAVKGGGQFIGISSAEPGTFAELVEAA